MSLYIYIYYMPLYVAICIYTICLYMSLYVADITLCRVASAHEPVAALEPVRSCQEAQEPVRSCQEAQEPVRSCQEAQERTLWRDTRALRASLASPARLHISECAAAPPSAASHRRPAALISASPPPRRRAGGVDGGPRDRARLPCRGGRSGRAAGDAVVTHPPLLFADGPAGAVA
jgi:hypothetical protein